ncbi:MAG: hypothetical protein COB02_12600 [Candidatus Cloacimonadota bacterium]|nr:MAG: hypothetical protein COB02_12600 [Candidatus Cloacimonadota bacterium]
MKTGLLMRSLRRKGFTLIEILVVIVIIGILATMGIGKYAQFSRDARKQSCVSNQNTIEKGLGMWEAKFVAIRTPDAGTVHEVTFRIDGDMDASSTALPSRINPITDGNRNQVYKMIQDDVVFICPETISAWSGIENVEDKTTTFDYKWIMNNRTDSGNDDTNGKVRGVGCLVWGTVAASPASDRGPADAVVVGGSGVDGPSGGSEDLHSGSTP